MATNEYQTFGDSGTDGVNKLSLTNYIADQDRVYGNGFTTKVVRSQLHNKALHQTSKMSAALAQFLVINNISALDTDSVATISNNIVSAVGNSTAVATHSATSKTTPVNADEIGIADSVSSFSLKKLTWANLKATLKTYFDGIYQSALGFTPLQQGGGIGQLISKVYIGWTGSNLKATVDWTDIGCFMFDSGSSMTINGYQKLSSGFIIQWGSATITSTSIAVTFPITFPNSCFSVAATKQHLDNNATYTISSSVGITNTGFTFQVGPVTGKFTWIAIGH